MRPTALSEGASAAADPAGADQRCAACGAAVLADQEWCVECGAARTMLRRPPDWRVPAALIGLLVTLILVGLLIALVSLSIQANHG